jgi:23S rRNA (guanosine2251-2'-O)-methyltransferase
MSPRSGKKPPAATIIYGRNPVREALCGGRRALSVLSVIEGRGGDDLLALLRQDSLAHGSDWPSVRRASAEELNRLSGSAEHQGVVAQTGPYPYVDSLGLLTAHDLIVALDRVQDPHNLGAVIRTADAAAAAVAIPRHRSAAVTPAVVRASAGASEHVAVAQARNLADFLLEAKARGFWVYGAVAGADSLYHDQDYRGPVVLVLGSEGEGLSHRVEEVCDVLVSLPLLGSVGSLNVSVAAGILLFEVLRQRGIAAPVGEAPVE